MATNPQRLLGTRSAFEVPAHIGQVRLIVTESPAAVSATVSAFMHRSPARIGIRVAGGCASVPDADKAAMLEYFSIAFQGFRGFVSSGATRSAKDGAVDPMVTDVPAVLAHQLGDQVLTLSTVPRTGEMALTDESRLVLDASHGINPQPGVHMIIVFQPRFSHEVLDWDGDLAGYFSLFQAFVDHAGWRFGMPVWNGGGVTEKEALQAAQLGWPVFLIEGTGRKADELAGRVRSGQLRGSFVLVHRDDPHTLQGAMISAGLMVA